MKGPNPFMLWEEKPESLVGRREDMRAFSAFMNAVSSKQPGVMVVNGGPGSGKTLLLRYFRQEAEKNGLLALFIKIEKNETIDDAIGKIHQEMVQGDYKGEKPGSMERLGGAVERFAGKKHFGAIVFIDDIDRMRKSNEAVSTIINIIRKSAGKGSIGFVLSSTAELRPEETTVINLRPFDEHDVRELVTNALKKGPPKMGEECINSIMADSSGNPRIFKTVCWYIYEMLKENEKVISKGHYLAYLAGVMSMLSREWFGRLYQETPAAEREILAALAKSDGMHVSDIAKKLGKPLGPVTALVGRLLNSGQIVKLERGKYRIFARLYAKYVAQRSPS